MIWSFIKQVLLRSAQQTIIDQFDLVCSAKSSSFWVFVLFMPPLVPVDIRDADLSARKTSKPLISDNLEKL